MTKHVLITGASSGIGRALALHLGRAGWRLTLAARREKELQELADALDVETFVRPTDLADRDTTSALVDESREALGPIDVLINNAGVQYVEPVMGVTAGRVDKLFDVDLVSPLRLIQHVLPAMVDRSSGTIVNVSSVAGLTHLPGMVHYNSAKAGLAAASESLRVELRDTGVHVLTLYPGPIESRMEAASRASFQPSWIIKHSPTGTPERLAELTHDAIVKKRARLFYPSSFKANFYLRVWNQWLADRLTPPLLLEDKDS